jgi:hypothetical protein
MNAISAHRFPEKGFGKADQQACAVPATAIGIDSAAVRQARQRAQSSLDQSMRRRPTELSHKAHSACVMIRRECEATLPHTLLV